MNLRTTQNKETRSYAAANNGAVGKAIQRKANQTGLPDNLKSGIENLSGYSMDDVNVHYHSSKPAQLNAHAYAQGTDIHIAPGQEKHLPHEAWHVVQQKQGRVRPTMQMKSAVPVNDDPILENEADMMGEKAVQFRLDVGLNAPAEQVSQAVVQRTKTTTGGLLGAVAGGIGGALYGGITGGLAAGPLGALTGALYYGSVGALTGGGVGLAGGAIAEHVSPTQKPKQREEPLIEHSEATSSQIFRPGLTRRHGLEDEKGGGGSSSSIMSSHAFEEPVDDDEYLDELEREIAVYSSGLSASKYASKLGGAPKRTAASLVRRLEDWKEVYRKEEGAASRASGKSSAQAAASPVVDLAAQARQTMIAPYIKLIPHLAGENDKSGEVTGGHLLIAMQEKYGSALIIQGEVSKNSVWVGLWGIKQDKLKKSTFFPASWDQAELVTELAGANRISGGLVLKSGILVEKKGDTFYPKLG